MIVTTLAVAAHPLSLTLVVDARGAADGAESMKLIGPTGTDHLLHRLVIYANSSHIFMYVCTFAKFKQSHQCPPLRLLAAPPCVGVHDATVRSH